MDSNLLMAVVSKPLDLDCQATGSPPLRYEWLRNGKKIGLNSNQTKGWVLHFGNLTYKDSGRYRCRVTNSISTRSRTFNLRVVSKCFVFDVKQLCFAIR